MLGEEADSLRERPGLELVADPHHVGDLVGVVEASSHPAYQAGDSVVLNGWGVGEVHWGGLAQKARHTESSARTRRADSPRITPGESTASNVAT